MHVSSQVLLPLLAAFVPVAAAAAQLQPQASYPLISDLLDTTTTYPPITLTGNPTPPAPPANGVCVNGIYSFNPGGQDVRTPNIGSLNSNDFQLDLEFSIAALPSLRAPVFMAGNGWRWIGIYLQANGTVGLKYNNNNFTWSTTTLAVGPWYIASVRYEAGTVELFIDGQMIHTAALGALNTGNNLNFTTNDFSNGLNHNGCIRNLVISNDTKLGGASAQNYGSGCDGLAMSAIGVPAIGNAAFALRLSNVPTVSAVAWIGFGRQVVNPGLDLAAIGMVGCASYTSLDLGVFGPVPVTGRTASFPLAIPNDPTLTGLVLYAQGISMSAATSLGLAVSNGTQLVLGL